jgi:fructokinase
MEELKRKLKVAGLGEILWDLLPQGKQLGGAPANFAYHTQLLGALGFVISAIGDDRLGHDILTQIKATGLSPTYIATDPDHPTGTVSVEVDNQGKPDYIIHTGVAWDFIPLKDTFLALVPDLDAICFGSLAQRAPVSRHTIETLLKSVSSACFKIFDVNIRQQFYSREVIEESLQISDCLKLNEDEFPLLAGLFGYTGKEERMIGIFLAEFDLQIIALTKGAEGSALYTKEHQSFKKSPPVKVVDTVGAGDAFTAALCIGYLNKFTIEKIHDGATRAAAYVCTQKGATPLLPDTLIREIINP